MQLMIKSARLRWISWLLVHLVAGVLSACGGGGGENTGPSSGGSPGGPVATTSTTPTIITDPISTTVLSGGSASFAVTATGNTPLSYQWQRDGVDVPGQNAPTLTLAVATSTDNAVYRVVVSNNAGRVTSGGAFLTVSVGAPLFINRAPVDGVATAGANASFDVQVTSSTPVTYQWKRNGSNIPGATSPTYKTPALTGADHGSLFSVSLTNAAGSVTSREVLLRVDGTGRINLFAGSIAGLGNTDGPRRGAQFFLPVGLAFDAMGAVTVLDGNLIRRIDANGAVTTVAGQRVDDSSYPPIDGPVSIARFKNLQAMAVDNAGNVFVSDQSAIRKISTTGLVTTFAGVNELSAYVDGAGSAARFYRPEGLAVDRAGNVYVADSGNGVIRKITPAGIVSTLAGSAGRFGSNDGVGPSARFGESGLGSIAVDATGVVYVVDALVNATIRKILPDGTVSTLAGLAGQRGATDGIGSEARFFDPSGITLAPDGNLYVIDSNATTVRRVTPAGKVTTVGTFTDRSKYSTSRPNGVAVDPTGRVYSSHYLSGTIYVMQPDGSSTLWAGTLAAPTAIGPQFNSFDSITVNGSGEAYVVDKSFLKILRISQSGEFGVFAGSGLNGSGDGPALQASFFLARQITQDTLGNFYVADGSAIRKISTMGVVSTIAGKADEPGEINANGASARFNTPNGIAIDAAGIIYVADTCAIRRIALNGDVTTLAGRIGSCVVSADGRGSAAAFRRVQGLTIDPAGNLTTIDYLSTIRRITSVGEVTTLAGSENARGLVDGIGSQARFLFPSALTANANGDVFVADGSVVRRVNLAGIVTTIIGTPGYNGFGGTAAGGVLSTIRGIAVSGGFVYLTMDGGTIVRFAL